MEEAGSMTQHWDDGIKKRIIIFQTRTSAVIETFRTGGKLRRVDGGCCVEEVQEQMCQILRDETRIPESYLIQHGNDSWIYLICFCRSLSSRVDQPR